MEQQSRLPEFLPVLSVVIPCYNEANYLESCVQRVLNIENERLNLELIIVDDCSRDSSLAIARRLADAHVNVRVLSHPVNQGKGAALRTGFMEATGDYVAVQDADLEYDPRDLIRLLGPLIDGEADAVIGSRFLSSGRHRVLYFWHSLGNRFLTFLSNMFTDLNLTDMETCYKVFRREIIQSIDIQENRFGFEPEIVAKLAHLRLRIYEIGVSYHGRTYEEGKKIGAKDGFRALYCIVRYNARYAPLPLQLMLYLLIGGFSALLNWAAFAILHDNGISVKPAAMVSFSLAAVINYLLCIILLFKHQAMWKKFTEWGVYLLVVIIVGSLDVFATHFLIRHGLTAGYAKMLASAMAFLFNFLGRKYFVFYEAPSSRWKPRRPSAP